MSKLPAEASAISALSQEDQFTVLDTLFEPSPELHTLLAPVLANQSFSSYNSLIDAVGGRMSALSAANSPVDRKILYGILGSHPRLGRAPPSATTATGDISELSKKEQAGFNAGAEEQAEKLKALNMEYENRFPGLRFVYVLFLSASSAMIYFKSFHKFIFFICCIYLSLKRFLCISTFVNGRSRDIIMQEMRLRIDRGDTEREVEEIIQVCLRA